MEPRGGHRRLFQETAQGSGAVENFGINCDDSQKVTQAVEEI